MASIDPLLCSNKHSSSPVLPPYQRGDRDSKVPVLQVQVGVQGAHQQVIKSSGATTSSSTGKEVNFFFKSEEETIGSAVSSELLETAEALLGRGSLTHQQVSAGLAALSSSHQVLSCLPRSMGAQWRISSSNQCRGRWRSS